MKEQILLIKPDGSFECVYNDDLLLQEIGETTIDRASNVEFNNETKKWDVIIKNEVLFSAYSRDEAISWEVDFLQDKLKQGKSIIEYTKG